MPKESATLTLRLSTRLKEDFRAMCDEDEIDMSDKVREIIANLVRSRKRQNGKAEKQEA
ncbi:hypothetical protein GCM10028806_56100 [Spirosoma terrae]|uniref:Uncharacterized protein n=1 Tax=Spirosoma terrae TaxID=1968276 RepID=A0A6L9LJP9_9BACT|nr:hypothetical protein [Spirosoma terrae]NDU96859.1 hypothetical protein [Spirosoma terrae]